MIRILGFFCLFGVCHAGDPIDWGPASSVPRSGSPSLRVQAIVSGDHLWIKVQHTPSWHTYAIDNAERALEALQGKKSLGVEQGLKFDVSPKVAFAGPWLQTKPQDFSKPELRWFTFGFDGTAYFARRLKEPASDALRVRITGQACSTDACVQIDEQLTPSASDKERHQAALTKILAALVPVDSKQASRKKQASTPAPQSSK